MSKEAVVVVLDISKSMEKTVRSGAQHGQCRREVAREAVSLLIREKLLYAPKDFISVVIVGTRKTKNPLQDDGYENITDMGDLIPATINLYQQIDSLESENTEGDFLDGIIVGFDMLVRFVRERKLKKRLFLVSDAATEVDLSEDDIRSLVDKIVGQSVHLNVVGIEFAKISYEADDEADEETNPTIPSSSGDIVKDRNEEALRKIVKRVNDLNGSAALVSAKDAMVMLSQVRATSVSIRSAFSDFFELSGAVKFPVKVFSCVSIAKLPTLRKETIAGEEATFRRKYHLIEDPDVEIAQEETIKGYRYGRSILPFNEIDDEVLKYHTGERHMKLIGFCQRSDIKDQYIIGNTLVVVPGSDIPVVAEAFAAMIQALHETEAVAIVRYVARRNAGVKLCVMYPYISTSKRYLCMNQLAFCESIRQFPFAPIIDPKNPATEMQEQATQELIDALRLDGDDVENDYNPKSVYNPVLQHFFESVHHKAGGNNGIPLVSDEVSRMVRRDQEMFAAAKEKIDNFKNAFGLKPVELSEDDDEGSGGRRTKRKLWSNILRDAKVGLEMYDNEGERKVKKKKGKKKGENLGEEQLPTGEMEDLNKSDGEKASSVGTAYPIEDFKEMISRKDGDFTERAITEMCALIFKFVEFSLRGVFFARALNCLIALRESCIQEEEAGRFNVFLREMKEKYSDSTVEDQARFWVKVSDRNINLISSSECSGGEVDASEVESFLNPEVKKEKPTEIAPPPAGGESVDDLLDMLE